MRAADAKINEDVATAHESERRLLSQQPNLDVTFFEIAEHHSSSVDVGFLTVSVQLRNSGVRNFAIIFDKTTVSMSRFDPDDVSRRHMFDVRRMEPMYLPEAGNKLTAMPPRLFRAGQQRNICFVAPVSTPGLYLVQFSALYEVYPFDGEQLPEQSAVPILALEQKIVSVTRKHDNRHQPASMSAAQ